MITNGNDYEQTNLKSKYEDVRMRLRELAVMINDSLAISTLDSIQSAGFDNKILFCGKYGKGKSTIINRLLETQLVPVEENPSRSYAVLIKHGDSESIILHDDNGKVIPIAADKLPKACKVISIKTPFPISLAQHQQFIEVPGTGAINEDHRNRLSEYLPKSSHVVFVMDMVLGLDNSEATFLKNLPREIQTILIVGNKADVIPLDDLNNSVSKFKTTIAELKLNRKVEVATISAESRDERLEHLWADFISMLNKLNITKTTMHEQDVPALLHQVAANLLSNFPTRSPKESSHQSKVESLNKTRLLILDVVKTQADDIYMTVADSLEATIFRLEEDLKSSSNKGAVIQQTISQWIDKEQVRTKERLQRLFNSVLSDVTYSTGHHNKLNVEFKSIAVAGYSQFDVIDESGVLSSDTLLQIGAVTGGAVVTLASRLLLAGALGWSASITVGGITAATLWILAEKSKLNPRESTLPLFSNIKHALLQGFNANILQNRDRLTQVVEKAFLEASATPLPEKEATSYIKAELKKIINDL